MRSSDAAAKVRNKAVHMGEKDLAIYSEPDRIQMLSIVCTWPLYHVKIRLTLLVYSTTKSRMRSWISFEEKKARC